VISIFKALQNIDLYTPHDNYNYNLLLYFRKP